jgi:hypothetical protein
LLARNDAQRRRGLGGIAGHPWLLAGRLIFLGKIEDPVGIDELVAEMEVHPLQGCLQLVVCRDAIWTDQQHEVRCRIGLGVQGGHPFFLAGDPRLDFLADDFRLEWQQHGSPVGMEDDPEQVAFDIEGPAILAALAAVGDDRIGVAVALASLLQVLQRLFQGQQFGRHARDFRPGRVGLGGSLGGVAGGLLLLLGRSPGRLLAASFQGLLLAQQAGLLGLQLLAQPRQLIHVGFQAPGRVAALPLHLQQLGPHCFLLAGQPGPQLQAGPLPVGADLFMTALPLGAACGGGLGGLLGNLRCRLLRPGQRGQLRPPVHGQQHQDQ